MPAGLHDAAVHVAQFRPWLGAPNRRESEDCLMPWRTALFNALRPGGSAPAATRVGLAVVGGVIILATAYVGLEMLRGSELSERALILLGMIFLAGLALIQAGKSGESSTR